MSQLWFPETYCQSAIQLFMYILQWIVANQSEMIVISFSTWIKHFSFSFLYCPLNSLWGYLVCSHEVTSTWIKHFSFRLLYYPVISFWSYFDKFACSYLDLNKAFFFRVSVVYCPLNSFWSYFDMVIGSYAIHWDQNTYYGRMCSFQIETKLSFEFLFLARTNNCQYNKHWNFYYC